MRNQKTKRNSAPRAKFRLVENGLYGQGDISAVLTSVELIFHAQSLFERFMVPDKLASSNCEIVIPTQSTQ